MNGADGVLPTVEQLDGEILSSDVGSTVIHQRYINITHGHRPVAATTDKMWTTDSQNFGL